MFLLSIGLAAALAADRPVAGQLGRDEVKPIAPTGEGGGPIARPDQRRYCVVDTVTGSRIPKRDCRTRQEWLGIGFDPLAKE